ncbi:hypothetical protein [Salmonella sp. NW160]|uniref:hypothetical protein n=1 Tax=Salmonella sp. NW160 TaxID=2947757 RepID=UPI003F4504EA
MQSILMSPVTGVAKGAGLSPTIPRSCYLRRQGRNSGMLVRCMAKDGKKEEVGTPLKAKVKTDFFDLLAFRGISSSTFTYRERKKKKREKKKWQES